MTSVRTCGATVAARRPSMAPSTAADPPEASARRFNPMLGIGAFVAFLILVALVVLVLQNRDDEVPTGVAPSPSVSVSASVSASAEASPTSAVTSPSASVEPSPSEVTGPPTIEWEEPVPFDGQPAHVMADGDTWVATGWATERGPGAWVSSDGVRWERADVVDPQPDDTFRGSGLGPTVRLGDSLLSYGTFIGCCDGRGVLGWRSLDGRSWEVIESDSPLFEDGYLVRGLVVGKPTLVAIESGYSAFAGRIWSWTESTSWVNVTPAPPDGDRPGILPADVVWDGERYVAVGVRGHPTGASPMSGASWASTDGTAWQGSPDISELAEVELLQVAPMPGGGYLALGIDDAANFSREGQTVAFTSSDGLAWTPVTAPPVDQPVHARELLVVEGGLVFVGSDGRGTTTISTSADGLTWTDPQQLDFTPAAAAARGDQVLLFAVDDIGGGGYYLHRGTLGP